MAMSTGGEFDGGGGVCVYLVLNIPTEREFVEFMQWKGNHGDTEVTEDARRNEITKLSSEITHK
jgi:hypothetical protein